MDPRKQRGFLNNNPGNMDRAVGEPWQGEIRDAADGRLSEFQRNELVKGRFSVFATPEFGIRAMAKNLFAYADRLDVHTVAGLIGKWAPPNENDTRAYINNVCVGLKNSPNDYVNVRNYETLAALVDAIIRVECGGMPYSGKEIEDGLRMAGVIKVPTVANSSTMRGAATATVATAAQPMVAAMQEPVQQLVDTMMPMADQPYVGYAILAAKILLGALALYGVYMMVRERKSRAVRDESLHTDGPMG